MKKLTWVALAFFAVTSSAISAETPKNVRISLEMMKNGKPVTKWDVALIEGLKAPFSTLKKVDYAAECTPGPAGKMTMKPATLVTGLTAEVTPIRVSADGAQLAVAFEYSELVAMKSTLIRGCGIEIPTVLKFSDSVTVQVKPGQASEVTKLSGADKYVFIVRGL